VAIVFQPEAICVTPTLMFRSGHAGCTYHSPGAVFASQAGAFKGCVKDFIIYGRKRQDLDLLEVLLKNSG
jgi:hypothetical protein